jgi:glutamate--cysteine ligase regulatory subunit
MILILYIIIAFKALHTDTIESLVIAYKSDENPENILSSLKRIWSIIEEYIKNGKLSSVGLSDINTNIFIELFQWADVRINDIKYLYTVISRF